MTISNQLLWRDNDDCSVCCLFQPELIGSVSLLDVKLNKK